jgi:O-antigen ligase
MRRSLLGYFVLAAAIVAPTIVVIPTIASYLALRFLFLLLVVAAGIPCLVTLALSQPLEASVLRQRPEVSRAPVGRSRTQSGARTRRSRAVRAAARAKPAVVVTQPGRLRLGARLGVAFAAWTTLAMVLSHHPAVSLFGTYLVGNGAVLTIALVAAWAIGVVIGREVASLLEWLLLAGVCANAIVAVLQSTFGYGLFQSRAPGFFLNPVTAGMFMIAGIWLVVHRMATDWRWAAVAALVAAGLQAAGSRFAILLLPVALVASVAIVGRSRAALLAGFVVFGLVIGGALTAVGGTQSASSRAAQGTAGGGFTPRLQMWSAGGHAVLNRPLVGAGPGRFAEATGPLRTLRYAQTEGPETTFGDAHNLVVEYAVTTGIPGVLLLVAFIVVALLLAGWRSSLAGFAILGLAMHLVQISEPVPTPLFFLALGAAATGAVPVKVVVPAAVRAAFVGLAVLVGSLISIGSLALNIRPRSSAQAYSQMRVARRLLSIWSDPFDRTASIDNNFVSTDPTAAQREIHWRLLAAQKEPDDPNAWSFLAEREDQSGYPANAQTHYLRALDDNPYSVITLNDLGQLLVKVGKPQLARPYFERSLKVVPGQPDIRAQLSASS